MLFAVGGGSRKQLDGLLDLRASAMERFVAWLTPCEYWKTTLNAMVGDCPRRASQFVTMEMHATSKGSVSLQAQSLSSHRS